MSQNISPLSPRDESRSSKTVTSLVGLVTKPTPALSAIYRKDRMRIPLQSRTLYRELGETGPESGDTAPQTLHVCSFSFPLLLNRTVFTPRKDPPRQPPEGGREASGASRHKRLSEQLCSRPQRPYLLSPRKQQRCSGTGKASTRRFLFCMCRPTFLRRADKCQCFRQGTGRSVSSLLTSVH